VHSNEADTADAARQGLRFWVDETRKDETRFGLVEQAARDLLRLAAPRDAVWMERVLADHMKHAGTWIETQCSLPDPTRGGNVSEIRLALYAMAFLGMIRIITSSKA
jgi:hypothetical protein